MKFPALGILAFSLLSVSCSHTMSKHQNTATLDLKVRARLKADIEVDSSRVLKGTAQQTRILGFMVGSASNFSDGVTYGAEGSSLGFFGPGLEESTKSAATYKAVTPAKADVLVAPQYTLRVKSYFFGAYKQVTAVVTGWSGKIKSIK
jgi:hypothetical protein